MLFGCLHTHLESMPRGARSFTFPGPQFPRFSGFDCSRLQALDFFDLIFFSRTIDTLFNVPIPEVRTPFHPF